MPDTQTDRRKPSQLIVRSAVRDGEATLHIQVLSAESDPVGNAKVRLLDHRDNVFHEVPLTNDLGEAFFKIDMRGDRRIDLTAFVVGSALEEIVHIFR